MLEEQPGIGGTLGRGNLAAVASVEQRDACHLTVVSKRRFKRKAGNNVVGQTTAYKNCERPLSGSANFRNRPEGDIQTTP